MGWQGKPRFPYIDTYYTTSQISNFEKNKKKYKKNTKKYKKIQKNTKKWKEQKTGFYSGLGIKFII